MIHKVALITGGSRGLGKVICKQLAKQGVTVVVNYATSKGNADQVVKEIKETGGNVYAVQADVTNEQAVLKMMEEIEETVGKSVDIIVNNATGPQPELSIEDANWSDYLEQLNFFVKAPLLITKAAIPAMKKQQFGRIINIGSEVVQLGSPNFSNYVTAKSAMLGMTRSWANELGEFGITVNLINPGFIPVERHEGLSDDAIEGYVQHVPLKKMGEPLDIAEAVCFLASEQGRFITGQSLSVNGGNTFGI